MSQTGQKSIPANFKIEITESAMLFENVFIITQDSLSVKKTSPSMRGYNDKFSAKLSLTDRQSLVDTLTKLDLSKIQKSYVDNSAPDDMCEYDFKISIDGQTKEFHIYQVKVNDIFHLVMQINGLLPDKFKIGYNDAYFKK